MILLTSDAARISGIVVYVILYLLFLRKSDVDILSSISDYLADFWKYRWFFFWNAVKTSLVFGLFVILTVYIPIYAGKPFIVITK